MSTASLNTVYGGGEFVPKFFSGCLSVPAGSTGNLLSINPPTGQRVRLLALTTGADGNTESNITITNSAGTVVSSLTLADASLDGTAGRFSVGVSISGANPTSRSIPYIDSIGNLTVSKSGGNTSVIIFYCYAFG